MRNTTKAANSGAPREPVRGLDHVTLALAGAGLFAFWCLLALWWLES